MATCVSDEVREVLAAADAGALFGPNRKRAQIRYRRLARMVHPDMGGSEEAMARLNVLWDEYNGRKPDSGRSLPEVMRNDRYAVFSEGEHWLVADRGHDLSLITGQSHKGVGRAIEGSPVRMLAWRRRKVIAQPDGMHAAYVCDVPASVRTAFALQGIASHLPGRVMHPADLAWVTKRVLFLEAALARCDAHMSHPIEDLALAPDTHMLCVIAPWDVVSGTAPRALVQEWRDCVEPCMQEDYQSRRIRQFLRGSVMDRVTDPMALFDEFDELLFELFGKPRFHAMDFTL